MTGLFPSVLVQTLRKQTRCLSVGPFFPPLLNQLCLFPLVLLKKLAEALFWGGFMFLLSPLLNLGRICESMKQCTSNSTTIRGLFYSIVNLWWGLPRGAKMLVEHVAWPSAHPPAALTFHYLAVSIYLSDLFSARDSLLSRIHIETFHLLLFSLAFLLDPPPFSVLLAPQPLYLVRPPCLPPSCLLWASDWL